MSRRLLCIGGPANGRSFTLDRPRVWRVASTDRATGLLGYRDDRIYHYRPAIVRLPGWTIDTLALVHGEGPEQGDELPGTARYDEPIVTYDRYGPDLSSGWCTAPGQFYVIRWLA